MEPMIILRRQPKYRQRTPDIPVRVVLIHLPKQLGNGKLTALDPQPRRIVDGGECHESTVSSADETVGVVWFLDGTCGGLQFAVEKLVEAFCWWEGWLLTRMVEIG
jgi:hypothetical protein